MENVLLRIKNLEVQYVVEKEVSRAVNGIDLELHKGEVLGLVGETGAGKTTTALSILRLLPKYISRIPNGTIEFDGRNLLEISEKEMREIRGEEISMIFQDPMTSLNPVATVGSQVADGIRLHNKGITRREVKERVDEIFRMVGIPPEREKEYPHQFSGGMKQRIMFAIAISCSPRLLIADEPTTALDVTIQAQIIKMMRNLQKQVDSGILFITHDLGLVANLCDKVAIMYAGEIVEAGTLEEIFDASREHHPYTVGLFHSIPDLNTKTKRLHPIPGLAPSPSRLPQGCKFYPRCEKCTESCMNGEITPVRNGSHVIKCNQVSKGGDHRG